jgi:hypothetical protein
MNRSGLLVALVMCGLVAACDDSPSSPSNPPAVFSALISGNNEIPIIANAEANGSGAAQISFSVTRDSTGAVTGGTATMFFQVTGLPPGTVLRGAHIHSGSATVNGPIVVDTGISATNTVTVSTGTAEFTYNNVAVSAATMNGILANPSLFYFNVHTPLNPAGVMRGQLRPVG